MVTRFKASFISCHLLKSWGFSRVSHKHQLERFFRYQWMLQCNTHKPQNWFQGKTYPIIFACYPHVSCLNHANDSPKKNAIHRNPQERSKKKHVKSCYINPPIAMPCYALLFPVEPPAESTVLKLRVREASERGPPRRSGAGRRSNSLVEWRSRLETPKHQRSMI